MSIWNKQTLYPTLATELLRLAYFTHQYLEGKAAGGLVRSLARLAGTWTDFKSVSFELSDTFQRSLISKEVTRTAEQAARRAHKFNSKIDSAIEKYNECVSILAGRKRFLARIYLLNLLQRSSQLLVTVFCFFLLPATIC